MKATMTPIARLFGTVRRLTAFRPTPLTIALVAFYLVCVLLSSPASPLR